MSQRFHTDIASLHPMNESATLPYYHLCWKKLEKHQHDIRATKRFSTLKALNKHQEPRHVKNLKEVSTPSPEWSSQLWGLT
ncbi:hypothetical protein [Rubritalea tangerina]